MRAEFAKPREADFTTETQRHGGKFKQDEQDRQDKYFFLICVIRVYLRLILS
jgi:hypothetical protein